MIDLHLHILPGVDDGAASPEDALAMAAALVDAGVHTAVATPHYHDWTRELLPDREAIERRTGDLRALLSEGQIPLTLVSGGECYLTPELIDAVRAGRAPTLGTGGYLLVELPTAQAVIHPEQVVAALHRHGVTVVLAHAERYGFVQKSTDALQPLLSCGIAVQVSLGSLGPRVSSAQRKAAEALLTEGLASVLATDAHAKRQIDEAAGLLERARVLVGDGILQLLIEENPRRVLAGEVVLSYEPVGPPARVNGRRWWPFGR